jgi:hypothetical protein
MLIRVVNVMMLLYCSGAIGATELINNGGFETGTFAGWTVVNLAGSFPGSSFFVTGSTVAPESGNRIVAPASGSFAAVSDQLGPGTHALLQPFTVPTGAASVVLSFRLFANTYGGLIVNPIGLDHRDGATQHARVDLLSGSAAPFDTGAGVLGNFYLGADTAMIVNPYRNYTFDITSLVSGGGAFQIRFAETDNQSFFNLGVDNVSVNATLAPEPDNYSMTLAAAIVLGGLRAGFRRRKSTT